MERFCIITNVNKDRDCLTAKRLKEFLEKKGKQCDSVLTRYTNTEEIPEDVECAVILGGDGTMIQAAIDLAYRDIPILGINLGTLGFLTTADKNHMFDALEQVFLGKYKIENRMMLECRFGSVAWHALNDFIIGKMDYGKLINVQVAINGERMDEYMADGLIVSTPTGSTAYNLSAGGPVLAPETRVIVITPICPHSLNNRSLVVSAEDVLEIRVGRTKEAGCDKAILVSDGREVSEMKTGDGVRVTVSPESTKIVRLLDVGFYHRLRSKLGGNGLGMKEETR